MGIVASTCSSDGSAAPELLEAAIDRLQQVVGPVFLQLHVGIAEDAEQVRAGDVEAREELGEIHPHDVFEKDERVPAAGHGAGQRDEARQDVGNLHARELRPPLMPDRDRQILAAIRDERERMARVEGERRQDRVDLRLEVSGQIVRDARLVFRRLEDADPVLGKGRPQLIVPARRLILQHRRRALADGGELFGDRQAVNRLRFEPGALFLEQRGHPNHEELVEVRGDDGEELDPLEQRVVLAHRLIEHAPIEREPAQLPVDVQRGMSEVCG